MQSMLAFPRPKKVVFSSMVLVFGLWVAFAVALHWASVDPKWFTWLVGTDAILTGEAWRLVTAWLVHQPVGNGAASHMLGTVLGLYFLGQSLEERWGPKRFAVFLLLSGTVSAALQVGLGALIAPLHSSPFFGGMGVVDAVAIAWALSNRGATVRLFFVLPVSATILVLFIVGLNVLYLVAGEQRHEGMVTPFGGMLMGYLLSDVSPVRRWFLKRQFRKVQAESAALRASRTDRSHLRIVKPTRDDRLN